MRRIIAPLRLHEQELITSARPKPLWKGEHILFCISKKEYCDQKVQDIKDGKVMPGSSYVPGRGRGRGRGHGGNRGRGDRRDNRDRGNRGKSSTLYELPQTNIVR